MVSGLPAVIGFSRSRTCTCTCVERSAVTTSRTGRPAATSTVAGDGVTVVPCTLIVIVCGAAELDPEAVGVPEPADADAEAVDAVPPQPARARASATPVGSRA